MKIAAKLFISFIFIAGLLLLFGSEELVARISTVSLENIVILTCLCTMSLMVLAKRFKLVIASEKIKEGWLRVFSVQMMGLSINQFTPGLYGGDVLRALYFMPKNQSRKRFLTAAVLFERMIGLLAMIILGILSSGIVGMQHEKRYWLGISFMQLLALFFLVAILRQINSGRLQNLFVNRWLRLTKDIAEIVAHLFSRKSLFMGALMLSLASQCISILAYFYLADCFQADLSLAAVACAVTVAWLVTMIPVSLNGLGLRESGLVIVMLSFGATKEAALSISIVALVPTMIHALAGALLIGLNFRTIIALKDQLKTSQ